MCPANVFILLLLFVFRYSLFIPNDYSIVVNLTLVDIKFSFNAWKKYSCPPTAMTDSRGDSSDSEQNVVSLIIRCSAYSNHSEAYASSKYID